MKPQFGLLPLPKDKRDFSLGALYKQPKLEELPESFDLGEMRVKNQGDTDYCTAYASCLASEFQEDVSLWPDYTFAASKKISGNKDAWGQNLRHACKGQTKYGAIVCVTLILYSHLSKIKTLWEFF